ncbi:unnamed protein product [Didymodactylos carnosus]|uniref:Uncharacterized protein n=1 Tax=Didymodactylos carnosus TaxID=1234261 RepID=A0A814YWL3_9BILA|nr:unnamed protein product [Didymodactylos carnosus]CAF3998251.1 unnamed protein product [Didymodactylos carnosus]
MTLNSILKIVDISSVKDRRQSDVVKNKCDSLMKEVKLLSTSINNLGSSSDTTIVEDLNYEDMQVFILGLKQLVSESDHSEKIRLLTICPEWWNRRDVVYHFDVTEWEARTAMKLRETSGVLSFCENKQDRGQITASTIEKVLEHYQDDSISRQSSNVKDVIQLKLADGTKIPKPCRIMLVSVTEAFENFKTFSSIVQQSVTSTDFVKKIVCSDTNLVCMNGTCLTCKNKSPSTELPNLYPMNLNEDVSWMTWAKVDNKIDIQKITGSVENLLKAMDEQWNKYLLHAFVTSEQFGFIKTLKESIGLYQAIIQMDFTENFSLDFQNEI